MKTSRLDFLSNAVEELFLFDSHLSGFLLCPFMFITEEMKNTMDHQENDHSHLVQTKLFHLTPGCLNRNDQIPEELRMKNGEFALPHREGKDVGRFVYTEISPIQYLDLSIINQ